MITFLLWKWASDDYKVKYTSESINIAAAQIRRHCSLPFRIIVVTDDPKGVAEETFPLWNDHASLPNIGGRFLPSCYRRLKMFDPETLKAMGIELGTRVCSIDADVIVQKSIDDLMSIKGDFIGWRVKGALKPRAFNGSLIAFTAGMFSHLWSEFDPINSPREAQRAGYLGSDQGYLSFKMVERPDASYWTYENGIAAFYREILNRRFPVSDFALIFFNGARKPWDRDMRAMYPWIKEHWRL